jgi:hypothetical protein
MSKCPNTNKLLQHLAENAKPLSGTKEFSKHPGIYGFFLSKGCLHIGRCKLTAGNGTLLYIGKTESSQRTRDARQHLANGGSGYSTLRRSLGALLLGQLSLKPQPRNGDITSKRQCISYKFDCKGEKQLTKWMKKHLSLGFCELPDLTIAKLRAHEKRLIMSAQPPLNLLHNPSSCYSSKLRDERKRCASLARMWSAER